MVDTGATTVAIDPETARAARLPKGHAETFNTAAGPTPGSIVPKQSVSAGGVRIEGLSIAVIDGIGEYGLLGQNFLRHLDVIQSGNEMILRAKAQGTATR
jgi:aspartyl protease family protein